MTSQYDGFKHDSSAEDPYLDLETEDSNSDPFELLSAYIDGELSPSERKQVQTWLDRDPEFKKLYTQLLTLQGHMQHSVAPASEKSTEEITAGVFQSLDRTRRWRRKLTWGGGAIAASVIAGVSGIIPGLSPLSPQMAELNSPNNNISNSVMLAVAVDRPTIDIPKSVGDLDYGNWNIEQN